MKIAVSSTGQNLNDDLDPSFGRCRGFLIYDTETLDAFFLDNSRNKELSQGAGTSAAQMLSAEGVEAVISGKIGPNALQAFNQAQIEVFASTASTVQKAIQAWEKGELQRVSAAKTPGGAGQGRGGGGRGRGPDQGGQGKGGGARGRGPGQGGRGQGGGVRGKGPGQGGRGMGRGGA